MTVSSAQVLARTGCRDTELFRLREIMGIDSHGSGRPLLYEERVADVFVSIWGVMLDFADINQAQNRHGLTWDAYGRLGAQLLRSDVAVLSSGNTRVEVHIISTVWSTILPERRTPTHPLPQLVGRRPR